MGRQPRATGLRSDVPGHPTHRRLERRDPIDHVSDGTDLSHSARSLTRRTPSRLRSCPGGYSCHLEVVELGADYSPKGAARRLTRKVVWPAGWPGRATAHPWCTATTSVAAVARRDPGRRAARADRDRRLLGASARRSRSSGPPGVPTFPEPRGHLPVRGGPPARGGRRLSPSLTGTRTCRRTGAGWLGVGPWGRGRRDLAGRVRRLEPGPAHPRTGALAGLAPVVAGRPPDRLRFLGEDGQWDIWTIDTDGGSLRRLTSNPADNNHADLVPDGRFVYFSSDRTGTQTIWRVPADGRGRRAGDSDRRRALRGGGRRPDALLPARPLGHRRSWPCRWPEARSERSSIACLATATPSVAAGVYHMGCGGDPHGVPPLPAGPGDRP